MTDNLHPVDELFRLRSEKTVIETRIDELRAMTADMEPAERTGREARAVVVEQKRVKPDIAKIRYEMGGKWLDERSTISTVNMVKVSRL